ncbi:MAG TPA: metallophosphoesterase [Clostridiaceae bacterium]|nr:metallophosphoesterase [Clostridiaceae bacterium]
MIYIFPFFFLLLILLVYSYLEAGFLEVKGVRICENNECLKIVQLSDIHFGRLRVKKEKIKREIEKVQPDIILITGDCIEDPKDVNGFLDFINYVKGNYMTCLCFGNHDYGAFINDNKALNDFVKNLNDIGIKVLQDEYIQYIKNNKIYNIIGFKDISTGSTHLVSALYNKEDNVFMNIGFAHNPDIIFRLPRKSLDYLLCGHFHGGQIWAPFNFEFRIFRKEKLCKMGIKRGLHKVRGINLYISRGIGNVIIPLRFLSPPEITVFYLP